MKKGKVVVGVGVLYFIIAIGIYCEEMKADLVNGSVAEKSEETVSETEHTVEEETIAECDERTDIISRRSLPDLERMEKKDQDKYVNHLQVIKKIESLRLGTEDFLYPEVSISNIEAVIEKNYIPDNRGKKVDFRGVTSQELQQVIDDNPKTVIDIISEQIRLTEPIVLHDDTIINGNGVRFIGEGVTYGFIAQDISGICLYNILIEGKIDYGMFFWNCDNLNITQNTIKGCRQKAICIIGITNGLKINNNEMSANQAGALYIAGDVSQGLIENNTVINNEGNSDWMAGIVLTDASPTKRGDIWSSVFGGQHQFSKSGDIGQSDYPHDLILRNNIITNNASAGIYSEGAYMCYLLNNRVSQNDKEGISLTHGTIGFYINKNTLEYNGGRKNQSYDDLEFELPGISLDNAAYNILENNNITGNYGGGIKMVRTAIRNLVIGNVIRDNYINKDNVSGGYGIELGVRLDGTEDVGVDYTPDYENIICRNVISGKHYTGIFIDEECFINDVFDNVIMDSEVYGIEAVSLKFNSMINNTTNCGIYNEFQ